MKSDELPRLTVVRNLLELARPLDEVAAQLAAMDWDYEGEGLELTRPHLLAVLRRYLEDTLRAKDVERWANLVEAREDIHIEKSYRQQIEDVLYELANPILTQSLDKRRASTLLDILA